jgi:hypothetical protein
MTIVGGLSLVTLYLPLVLVMRSQRSLSARRVQSSLTMPFLKSRTSNAEVGTMGPTRQQG